MTLIKNNKPTRIAVIGCGQLGNLHLDNLLKMDGIEVVALYNRGISNLEKTAKKVPKARLYQDLTKMLTKEKLDAVIISLIPTMHGEVEELCCKKGIHMYIEKPLAMSASVASKINDAIKYSNVLVSVGYQERYSSAIEIVREILQKETVGLVQGYYIDSLPKAQWCRLKEESGGQILTQSTQIIDILRYLLGDISSVYATASSNPNFGLPAHTVDDYSSMLLSFKSGVIANLQTACYVKGDAVSKVGFDITTPRCQIEYRWGKYLKVTSGERSEEVNILTDNYFVSLSTFVKAVKSGDVINIKSNYEDAIKTLYVTLSANSSIKSGSTEQIS